MKEKTSMIMLSIGVWIFLFFSPDLVKAKDPDYPTKPITFYIPYAAGGSTDVAVRPLLEAVGKHLGQPIIPVSKPGGSATIGAMAVMNAKPDGYTLGAHAGAHIYTLPHMEECPYKDLSGFTFIMNYGKYIFPIIVRSDAPFKTWKEFIQWARQNPRAAKTGLVGGKVQTPQGWAMWEVEQKEKVEFAYIVFKSSTESLSALLGGHTNLDATACSPSSMEYVKQGKLRILVYVTKEKAPGYEDIPSLQELYGIAATTYMGVWGPKGLPNYALQRLDEAFAKGVKDPHFIDVMNRMYTPVVYMSRAELNRDVNEMFQKGAKMLKILRAEETKEKK